MTMVTVLELRTNLCILNAKSGKTSQPTKQHKQQNRPPQKPNRNRTRNKQNTGNPNEGETVKQAWLSVSEDPGSQNISSDK